ncbi:MAG: hypothetical protein FWH16_01205 [Oscillospiraceae bacterium]|nr:hypothetical protein [Oscillospiraceae bacterium]
MSNSNLEFLAKNLLAKGKNTVPGIDKYMGILDTEEGKRLLGQLSANGGDSLKSAAQKAAGGDTAATKDLIKTILSSKEGKALAAQVMEINKKSK